MNHQTELARRLGHALCDQLQAMSSSAAALTVDDAFDVVCEQVSMLCFIAAGALRAKGETELAKRFEEVPL